MRSLPIRSLLLSFYHRFPWMEPEELLEYFAVYGGVEEAVDFDFFEDLETSLIRHFSKEFHRYSQLIRPEYLRKPPYRQLLITLARGDGKMFSAFRRAGLTETAGGSLLDEMIRLGTLQLEHSREAPIRSRPGRPIRRELRSYRIQNKIRFHRPYDRFWFAFVEPYSEQLEHKETENFLANWHEHREQAVSLVFEQLSNDLLELHFSGEDPLLSKGSHWDFHNEFDLLAHTRSGRLILGECKYTGRPVCRNELKKLREKAALSGIKADLFALFSRSGFSRELREHREPDLLLFDLSNFRRLLEEKSSG